MIAGTWNLLNDLTTQLFVLSNLPITHRRLNEWRAHSRDCLLKRDKESLKYECHVYLMCERSAAGWYHRVTDGCLDLNKGERFRRFERVITFERLIAKSKICYEVRRKQAYLSETVIVVLECMFRAVNVGLDYEIEILSGYKWYKTAFCVTRLQSATLSPEINT